MSNLYDQDYRATVNRINNRFAAIQSDDPLFVVEPRSDLWLTYLNTFEAYERQYHNCNECRKFIERFGGIVTITPEGEVVSALWNPAHTSHAESIAFGRLQALVERSPIKGVFVSDEETLGTPVTGLWRHFAVKNNDVWTSRVQTASQRAAEKSEDFKNVKRALGEFTLKQLELAVEFLESDALYRADKVIGPARFLADLKRTYRKQDNLIWRAVATAPAGYCHPRSSMIGTLLEDIQAGKDFEDVKRAFAAKMNPLQYMRPTAAPSAGNIAQAEKLFEQLGFARSLERRFAAWEEVPSIWVAKPEKKQGVFGHLHNERPIASIGGSTNITWTKFQRDILPKAEQIDVLVPYSGPFTAVTTAVHPDAPPLFKWNHSLAWYMYAYPSRATQFNLQANQWTPVIAIAQTFDGGQRVLLMLRGARDLRGAHTGIFPENLRPELHSVRSTIEAHAGRATARGTGTANGLMFSNGSPVTVRVRTARTTQTYNLDRWE